MRITSKGQVTIPVDIREELGLLPHTEVVFEIEGRAAKILKADAREQSRGRKLVEHLRGRGTVQMTTEEILALTRGDD